MSRRVSLPGADELFRTTGGMGLQASSPAERRRKANGEARVPAPAGEGDPAADTGQGGAPGGGDTPAPAGASREEHSAADADGGGSRSRAEGDVRGAAAPPRTRTTPAQEAAPTVQPQRGRGGGGRGANRRPSGRERHDEKITVYVSAEELMDLEHARLVLRGEHGLAVDRGRIVREAVAVVLADLESRGDASILVRRLRGR
ncbi:hypothetical protein [Streptomyces pratensis]|uniref:hypothetical protein n=1 Tax=Streptomyces pratensis TaxID=1169025 RepID=UPI001EE44CBB|nr:hypothetical protein [Streptomyces pratensis]